MPRRGREKIVMVRGAEKAMEAFTFEIAKELGIYDKIMEGGYNNLTTFEAGRLGGTMTRTIQAMGEQLIMDRYNKGEEQLIPDDLAPDKDLMRDFTNNGNLVVEGKIKDTKHKDLKAIVTEDMGSPEPDERGGQRPSTSQRDYIMQ